MSEPGLYPVPDEWARRARVGADDYRRLYRQSIDQPDAFWAEQVGRLDWMVRPTRFDESSFDEANFQVRWFADGELNVSVNCLDRHLATGGEDFAIVWEPDRPEEEPVRLTYRELHARVCKVATVLKSLGVAKGDRVTIYLPMIPEAAIAMLACARIGAIH